MTRFPIKVNISECAICAFLPSKCRKPGNEDNITNSENYLQERHHWYLNFCKYWYVRFNLYPKMILCIYFIIYFRQQTPLLLAVSQGHQAIVERLVAWRASVNAQDEDGDSPLHVALIKRPALRGGEPADPQDAPAMAHIRATLATSVCLPPTAHNGIPLLLSQNASNGTRNQTAIAGGTVESQTTSDDEGLVIACYLAR